MIDKYIMKGILKMKKTKNILSIVCALLVLTTCIFMSGCSGDNDKSSSEQSAAETTAEAPTEQETIGGKTITAVIDIKNYGKITVALYPESAPITVENFVNLAKDGFYDNLTFHRIISGFMIQGGDPLGTGMGGSEKTIKGEFSSNGIENNLKHTRGAISMARSQDMNSASSQFFIVHQDSPHLNGDYAAFGYVTDGIEIVDKICEDTPVVDSNGTVEKANQPVIKSITIKE